MSNRNSSCQPHGYLAHQQTRTNRKPSGEGLSRRPEREHTQEAHGKGVLSRGSVLRGGPRPGLGTDGAMLTWCLDA